MASSRPSQIGHIYGQSDAKKFRAPPEGARFLQHISKNFCWAGQFYNATLFFCRYEAITVLAQSDFTLILLNKHGLVGFSRTVGQIVSEPGNESD